MYGNGDPDGIQLEFETNMQIDKFEPDSTYDAILKNDYDGTNFVIAIGKLNNQDKTNTNTTNDGGIIIGNLVIKSSASGSIKLNTDNSSIVYGTSSLKFSDFSLDF